MMDGDEQDAIPAARASKGGRPSREYARALSGNILKAALAVLIERGHGDFTMSLVADRANVSKKTLYTRFASKDELLAAVVDHTLETHVWEFGRAKAGGPVKKRLFDCLAAFLLNTFKPEIIAVEQIFVVYEELQFQPRVRATRLIPVRIVVELLEEAKRLGEADYESPLTVAFMFFDTMVLGPRTRFLKLTEDEKKLMPVDANAAAVFDMMWRGLTPRDG